MTEFVALRSKTFSYLMDDDSDEKVKGTKKGEIKRRLKLNCLLNNKTILKSQ